MGQLRTECQSVQFPEGRPRLVAPQAKRTNGGIGKIARSCATFVTGRPCQELVAQLVEQRTFNAWVLGSIPSELTTPQATNPLNLP